MEKKRLYPDESVKSAYRMAIRQLRDAQSRDQVRELKAQIEFLERLYKL